jgi:SAM-dependent methyltransferase
VDVKGFAVPRHLCRNAVDDPATAVEDAAWLIDHLCGHIGVRDLGDLAVLDVGCGVRFTQAFLTGDIPIRRYAGIDASREVIEFLRSNVSDPRFEFVHLDARNDLYNPNGTPLAQLAVPELAGRRFDVICLFSVFTHLAPGDYAAMLNLLRPLVADDGWLFYTLFVNERTEAGHGYVDKVSAGIAQAGGVPQELLEAHAGPDAEPPPFRDARPETPLLFALYSRRHALELVEGTGWDLQSISPPSDPRLQHHIVCRPGRRGRSGVR